MSDIEPMRIGFGRQWIPTMALITLIVFLLASIVFIWVWRVRQRDAELELLGENDILYIPDTETMEAYEESWSYPLQKFVLGKNPHNPVGTVYDGFGLNNRTATPTQLWNIILKQSTLTKSDVCLPIDNETLSRLASHSMLESVCFAEGCGVTDGMLARIPSSCRWTSLTLTAPEITTEGILAAIYRCRELVSIEISARECTPSLVSALVRYPTINAISVKYSADQPYQTKLNDVFGTEWDSKSLTIMGNSSNPPLLDFDGFKVGDISIKHLPTLHVNGLTCRTLRTSYVKNVKCEQLTSTVAEISDAVVLQVENSPGLMELTIQGGESESATIRRCSSLNRLKVFNRAWKTFEFQTLPSLTTLETEILTMELASQLTKCPSLSTISFAGESNNIDANAIPTLRALPNLRKVEFAWSYRGQELQHVIDIFIKETSVVEIAFLVQYDFSNDFPPWLASIQERYPKVKFARK